MSVLVNHDYPQVHALQVLELDGTPIEGARITVYNANRYYAQDMSGWITQQGVLFEEPWDSTFILFGDPEAFNVVLQTSWVGEVYTDVNGEWLTDLLLDEAQTWLIRIEHHPEFAPRTLEVTT